MHACDFGLTSRTASHPASPLSPGVGQGLNDQPVTSFLGAATAAHSTYCFQIDILSYGFIYNTRAMVVRQYLHYIELLSPRIV